MSVRGGGVNGSGTQACASCKYQRRKCTPDCLLAPYFPPDQQRQFLNAHKLFGVSNIGKIIKNVDPIQRAEAMRSIVFQSDARARDPVGGCHRIILELQRQIERDTIELDLVLRQLAVFREQARAQNHHLHHQYHLSAVAAADDLMVGLDINSMSMPMQQQHQQQQFAIMNNNNNSNHHRMRYHHQPQHHDHHHPPLHYEELMPQVMPTPATSYVIEGASSSSNHVRPLFNDFEDSKPQFDMFEQKPDFTIDGADSFSDGETMKDEQNPMEQVQEHDLKGAASLFTLTN